MIDQLKSQAISGVKWNGISMGGVTLFHFVSLAVLARLLSSSDFGLMGMIMVVMGVAQAFSDMGLSNALIQRQNVPRDHLSSLFWINVLAGVLLFVCVLSVRSLVSTFFREPNLLNYLYFASFIFLLASPSQIFTTLLRKELRFKMLSKIEIAGTVVYSLSATGLALAHFGVLSLIFGQLIRSAFTLAILVLVFRASWLPRFHFRIKEIQTYLSFGAFQMGERVVNYLSANIDYIIIGRFLGPSGLGFYTLAYQITMFPLTKVNPIITKVAFPVFSKIQDDNRRMGNAYCKIIKYIAVFSFPLLTGMLVVAPEFIRLVYGAKWEPSIPVLQILCLVGILKSLGNPIGSILLAKGRADIGFYWNVFAVFGVSVAVIVGANWGIVGVATAILILQIPFFLIIQPIVNRLINLRLTQYLKTLVNPFICTAIMFAVTILLRRLFIDINILALFAMIVMAGGLIYAASYYIKDSGTFIELKSMLTGT